MFLKFSIFALCAALATAECDNANWCINFDDAEAQIGGTGPDIKVLYKDIPGDAPDGTNKYFASTLFTVGAGDTCETATGAADQGITLEDHKKNADGKWEVTMDIDTATIEDKAFATDNGDNTFKIQFCVKTDIMTTITGASPPNMAVESASTILTFNVDKAKGFEIRDFAAAPDAATLDAETAVTVNIAVNAEFCDINFAADASYTANSIKPGQAIDFCVSTPSNEATIESVRDIKFTTTEASSDTNIPIVDGTGNKVGLSDVNCPTTGDNIGKCRVSSVAYARVFERVVAGQLEAINNIAMITGTAVLKLGRRRVLAEVNFRGSSDRKLQDEGTPVNSFDLNVAENLEAPPDRSSAPSTTVALLSMMMTGLVGFLMA